MANEPTHFCDVPTTALCGRNLADNDFERFHNHTTNAFKAVTCEQCRHRILTRRLTPFGFKAPPEWSQKETP